MDDPDVENSGLKDDEKGAGSPEAASRVPATDETNYEHRHFINLLSIAFLLVVAVAIIWTVKAMEENERMQRCISSGRRNCVQLDVPQPAATVRMLIR